MIRSYTWADFLTIGNASCGTIAIFLCLDYLATGTPRFLWTAFILLPAALVCDVLDGYVARMNANTALVRVSDVTSTTLNALAQNLSPRIARVGAVIGF